MKDIYSLCVLLKYFLPGEMLKYVQIRQYLTLKVNSATC